MSHSFPAQPQGTTRRPSLWGKMCDGLMANHKNEKPCEEVELRSDDHDDVDPFDTSRPSFTTNPFATTKSSAIDTTTPVHKRNASIAASSTKSRSGSVVSISSRRGSKRWWRSNSSNPEDELPPVPIIDTKFTAAPSSHNPELLSATSAGSRKNSYVPRNAAGSFLRTTTPAPKTKQEDLDETARRLSTSGGAAAINPLQAKTGENRKDSHGQPEAHGLSSMAGICDILEVEEPVLEKKPVRSVSPLPETSVRQDSAKGSPELIVTKASGQRDPSVHELCA